MPTRLRLNCRALLVIDLVKPNFYSAGTQASHQLNLALSTATLLQRRSRAVVLKKEVGGRLKQDLDKDFSNNLGLHTRTLIHVGKIATPRMFGLVLRYSYSCLSVCSRSILILLY